MVRHYRTSKISRPRQMNFWITRDVPRLHAIRVAIRANARVSHVCFSLNYYV